MQAKPKQVTESFKIDNPQQLLHILEAARGNFGRRHIWLCEGALICLSHEHEWPKCYRRCYEK